MKRLILVSIASLLLSTYANAEIVWKTPPTRACTSKGGKLENGICKADWQSAKDICRTLGFRLPTIDELRMAITDCGGVDGSSHNKSYIYYQECYQRRGFSGKGAYWSSTETNSESSVAWSVNFKNGYGAWYSKSGEGYALCVRGE
jgi:hypothetical protein